MKRKFLSIFAAAVLALAVASCSKSNEQLLNEYSDLCKEAVEASKSGDLVKMMSIAEKGTKVEKELSERTLTDQEKEKLTKITEEMAEALAAQEKKTEE